MTIKLQAIKIDRTVQGDREIQLPFKCFACHDGGLAGGRYLTMFVEGESDIPFLCNREECDVGRVRRTAYSANSDPSYRNAFDARLDKYACDDIHKWEKQLFIEDMLHRRTKHQAPAPVVKIYDQAVSDRQLLFKEIQVEIAKFDPEFINPKVENFLKQRCDRDGIEYSSTEALPTNDYQVLLSKIKKLKPID
jgi:hypothetical protein